MWSDLVHDQPQVVEIEELKQRLKERAKVEFARLVSEKKTQTNIEVAIRNCEDTLNELDENLQVGAQSMLYTHCTHYTHNTHDIHDTHHTHHTPYTPYTPLYTPIHPYTHYTYYTPLGGRGPSYDEVPERQALSVRRSMYCKCCW